MWRRALEAADAVELVHNFSLVHDDIQGGDRARRHQPTVWAVWGEGQAINAGDALLSLAQIAVLGLAQEGLPAASVVEAARILNGRTLEMDGSTPNFRAAESDIARAGGVSTRTRT